jgi:hypothetical protein
MSVSELNVTIDFEKLLETYNTLKIDELLKNSNNNQIAVQCRAECSIEDQLHQGTGSLMYEWSESGDPILRKNKFKQFEFTEICQYFRGTYIESIINTISETYTIQRTRFMMSKPKTCLSTHTDPTKRIHIPIYTNNDCYMVFTDKVFRMLPGKVYIADTTHDHTAVNTSYQFRTHLVMCLGQEFS